MCVFLASCVSQKSAPQAYYSGVYVPGKVEFGSRGSFTSTAGVFSQDNVAVARKAAYARFMLEAKKRGYRYFEISGEKTTSGFGKRYTLSGRAHKSPVYNGRTYRVDGVKQVLNGGKLVAIKHPPAQKPKVKPKPRKRPVNKAAEVKPSAAPAAKPAAAANPVSSPEVSPAEEPTVIMAPEDITGSIRRNAVQGGVVQGSTGTGSIMTTPPAVSDLPRGVLLRRK